MAKEVFGRHEAKYYLDEKTFALFHQAIQTYLELDAYNTSGDLYRVYNLYVDTKDNNIIRTSLSKPKYKEKIRIRSYQPFTSEDMVFLEIKKKYNHFVSKRRTNIRFKDAVKFVEQGLLPTIEPGMNPQVLHELKYMIDKEQLYVKTYLTYDRMAYFSKEQSDLRITFDTNVQAQNEGQDPISIVPEGTWLMEIKAERAFPVWLVKLLSQHRIFKQSFSKFGKAYEYNLRHGTLLKATPDEVIKHYFLEEDTPYVRNTFEFKY